MYSMVLMAALTTGTNLPDCHKSCGCWGCYGCGCFGCWGCHGCYGCGGCWGCWGCGGCYGCWGGCYGGWGGYGHWYGNGWGPCYGCYGDGYYGGVIVEPGARRKARDVEEDDAEMKKDDKESSLPRRAKLIVELPADAKLYIDGVAMKTTSARRVFSTPDLAKGQSYYYDLKAEAIRDGQTVTRTKRVVLKAGQQVRAAFDDLESVASVKAD